MSGQNPTPPAESAASAADAYVYGYPLVSGLSAVDAALHKGFGTLGPAPFNHFSHAGRLASPDDHFVSVNNDTVYSVAQLDLSGGPLLLDVPDTDGAYCVLQFVDAWTNNFAYLGSRATGTAKSRWLIAPPGWPGSEPDDVTGVIDAPTSVVTLVGRNACGGPDDMPRVAAIQQGLVLTPQDGAEHRTGLPAVDPDVPDELRFFERLRVWMADFPPSAADQAYQDRFQPLGLLEEGPSPYVNAEPALVRALREGLAAGKERIENASKAAASDQYSQAQARPGEWGMNPHLFDYNLDHLGIGTIDSTQWRIDDREASYLTRAVAARTALWGSHGYEAVSASTSTDAEGRPLTGATSYTVRFEQPPPVGSFWSMTMYDTPDQQLVDNPIGCYSIGDRTPGLVYADDGSLTICIGRERPSHPVEAANWLPAPEGGFRPLIRLYTPNEAVTDGSYRLPTIRPRAAQAG